MDGGEWPIGAIAVLDRNSLQVTGGKWLMVGHLGQQSDANRPTIEESQSRETPGLR